MGGGGGAYFFQNWPSLLVVWVYIPRSGQVRDTPPTPITALLGGLTPPPPPILGWEFNKDMFCRRLGHWESCTNFEIV